MGDLRDAFKKAGLIDDKTARRLEHEQRVERKQLGREGLDEQARAQEQERRQRDEQKAAQTKQAQRQHDAGRQQEERWKKLVRELETQAVTASGPRRFHYHEPDGHLPYLLVDDDNGRRIEAGELAIVRMPGSEAAALVPRAVAAELHALAPDRILHVAGGGR